MSYGAITRAVNEAGHDDPYELEVLLANRDRLRGTYVKHNVDALILDVDVGERDRIRHFINPGHVIACAVHPE